MHILRVTQRVSESTREVCVFSVPLPSIDLIGYNYVDAGKAKGSDSKSENKTNETNGKINQKGKIVLKSGYVEEIDLSLPTQFIIINNVVEEGKPIKVVKSTTSVEEIDAYIIQQFEEAALPCDSFH